MVLILRPNQPENISLKKKKQFLRKISFPNVNIEENSNHAIEVVPIINTRISPEKPMGDEILRVCRTCLKILNEKETVPLVIQPSGEKTELYRRLSSVLQLELFVVENPCLCQNCESFINAVYDFRETCQINETVLKEFDWENKTKNLLHVVDKNELICKYIESEISASLDVETNKNAARDIDCKEKTTNLPYGGKDEDKCKNEENNISSTLDTEEILPGFLTMSGSSRSEDYWEQLWKEKDETGNGLSDMDDHWYDEDKLIGIDHDYPNNSWEEGEAVDGIFSTSLDKCFSRISNGHSSFKLSKIISQYTRRGEAVPPFLCELCGKMQNCKTTWRNHRRLHYSQKNFLGFRCEDCTLIFQNRLVYQHHIKSQHGGPKRKFKCPICSRLYCTQSSVDKHVAFHKLSKRK